VEDAAQVISRMCDVIMLRTFEQDIIERFARQLARAVINGPDRRVPPLPDPRRHLHLHRAARRGPRRTVAWIATRTTSCNTWLEAARDLRFKLHISTPPATKSSRNA